MNVADLLIRDFIEGWFATAPASRRLLDLGCGQQPYAPLYAGTARSVVLLDFERRGSDHRGAFVRGSADRLPFAAAAFDTVLCTEVLEHVPDPAAAARELARVVAPNGVVLLTVPFLHGLHEVPRDYFRFTPWGLRALFERDFHVERVVARGGAVAVWLTWISGLLSRIPWLLTLPLPQRWRSAVRSRTSPLSYLYLAAWRLSQRPTPRALLELLAIPEVAERNTLGWMCVLRRRGGAA
jgi:SAM-dependent methyltransferase